MKLGNLLELLYLARHSFRTVQIGWKYWYRVDLMQEIPENVFSFIPPPQTFVELCE